MQQGTRGRLAIALVVGVTIGTLVWAGRAEAFWTWFKLQQCSADLQTCDGDLATCDDDLAQCQADTKTFPGDGYPNPDTWDVSGHGPALDYTDNGDGTATDNKTKFVWEIKLPDNDFDGNCADGVQENRSVHCVNNTYKWSVAPPAADGALFDEFLWALNNTCSEDWLMPYKDLKACDVKLGGCTDSCGFAGYTDWEIPNIKILQSIVDYSRKLPAISPTFPGATTDAAHWSSTTAVNSTTLAWLLNFGLGDPGQGSKGTAKWVRAVRVGSD